MSMIPDVKYRCIKGNDESMVHDKFIIYRELGIISVSFAI